MNYIQRFFSTDTTSWSLLIARLTLGAVILPHGMQKALGLFGGYGFEGTVTGFTSMGMPALLAVMVILAEFVGALGAILGFFTRFMAFSITLTMTGAMFISGSLKNGFFMNWFGNQAGDGIEYYLLVIGLGLAVMLGGAGRYGLDNLVSLILATRRVQPVKMGLS
ncbi:MAG: DoxX family protein [Bacteroidales bacterium]|nr:DoxX family protein [Bacteroidales bacterium]